jgi:Uma2 family endonuclease
MVATMRWTSADLELLQHDDNRYEIIDGELYVTTQPSWDHQFSGGLIFMALQSWSAQSGLGQANLAPGVIFSEDNAVAPDVIWVSHSRLTGALDDAGHLHITPELIVEILSPGIKNVQRDREAKLKLYSERGVTEYWIADSRLGLIERYRRENAVLQLVETLQAADTLQLPLLPGFRVQVGQLFRRS